MNPRHVRVLLADDHEVVRTGVRAMIEAHGGLEVCGEATNGNDAVRLAAEIQPDVVVLDLELGEMDGVAVTRRVKQRSPQSEVLIFTMHDSEYLIRAAFAAGARAFVLKSEGGGRLIQAIECVSEHKPFFA